MQSTFIEDDYISQFLINDFDLNLNELFTFYLPPPGVKNIEKNVEKNNKLFTEDQIQFAAKKINEDIKSKRLAEGKKYPRFAEDFKYSAIVIPSHTHSYIVNTTYTLNTYSLLFSLYAVYPGKKQNFEKYFGSHSQIKWVQHMNSEWILAKYIVQTQNYRNYFSENKPEKKKLPRIQYKKTATPIESLQQYRNTDHEIEILKILGKYRGHVERETKQGLLQKIILMQNAGESTLEDFLNKNETLTTQQVLIIGLQLLSAYHKNFRLGIMHRNIKPTKIMIETIEDEKKYAIEIVGWSSAVYIRKNKKEHTIVSIVDENGYGTACYADHEIAAKILEQSNDPLTTAKSLAIFNKRLVIELIIDKKKVDYKFMINFVRALVFIENQVEGRIVKHFSQDNTSKYILPIMNQDNRAAEVLASTVIYLLHTENDFKDKDLSIIKSFLDAMHDAFKTTLKSDIDDISTKLADNNEKLNSVEYNEKSEIYSIARVLEELLKKTNKEDNKFLRGLVFKFITKKCKNVNRDYRPTVVEAIKTFRSYIKKLDKLNDTDIYSLQPNSLHFKSSEYLYENTSIQTQGYVDLISLQHLINKNAPIDFLRLKKYQVVFVLDEIRVSSDINTIDDIQKVKKKLQEEGIRVSGFVLVRNNPYRSMLESKRTKLSSEHKSITISSIPVSKKSSKDKDFDSEFPPSMNAGNLTNKMDQPSAPQSESKEGKIMHNTEQELKNDVIENMTKNLNTIQTLSITSNPKLSSLPSVKAHNLPNDLSSTGYFNPCGTEDERQREKARRAMERKFTINPDSEKNKQIFSEKKSPFKHFIKPSEKKPKDKKDDTHTHSEKFKNKTNSLFFSTRDVNKRKSRELTVTFFQPMEPAPIIITNSNSQDPSLNSPASLTPATETPKLGAT